MGKVRRMADQEAPGQAATPVLAETGALDPPHHLAQRVRSGSAGRPPRGASETSAGSCPPGPAGAMDGRSPRPASPLATARRLRAPDRALRPGNLSQPATRSPAAASRSPLPRPAHARAAAALPSGRDGDIYTTPAGRPGGRRRDGLARAGRAGACCLRGRARRRTAVRKGGAGSRTREGIRGSGRSARPAPRRSGSRGRNGVPAQSSRHGPPRPRVHAATARRSAIPPPSPRCSLPTSSPAPVTARAPSFRAGKRRRHRWRTGDLQAPAR